MTESAAEKHGSNTAPDLETSAPDSRQPHPAAEHKSLRIGLLLLALIGAVLSGVSLHNHYGEEVTDYCSLDDSINCDLVNRSVYSEFLDIPVAAIGMFGYGVLFLLALPRRPGRAMRVVRSMASAAGLLFSLYLTYVEARVLAVWCMLCVASLIAILAITALCIISLIGSCAFGARAGSPHALRSGCPAMKC